MAIDVRSAVTKPAVGTKFAAAFVSGFLTPAFGSRSKTEVDLLVFSALVEAAAIDPEAPLFDIARALSISPARARALVFNWQLRTFSPTDLRTAFAKAIKKTRFAKDGTLLTFGIESPLVREELIASLKRKGFFADASFSKEIVRLPVEALVEFLDEIIGEKEKEEVRSALVKDKQLPDTSFKALAKGVLMKLGEKVAGEVGKEVAGSIATKAAKPIIDKAVGFLSGILSGDPKSAVKGITKDDFVDV